MNTHSSPGSVADSDDCSPRSSPTRSNTAPPSVHSFFPGQTRHGSPTRSTRFQSDVLPSSNFEVNGFLGVGPQNQHSNFATQASTLVQQENEVGLLGYGELAEDGLTASCDPMEDLPSKDWEELETRFDGDMEAAVQHEQSIIDEIEWVMKMMKESTTASSKTESERARKRLRTRIAYVQQSEETLAEKRKHYKGVVDAFQNAMALLGGI
ncbi:hypothetical protein GJ744_006121 [Endocarpon pusillum]|uniref:Uncharacterized protein n=1 Tax=Endocarpon pusillum TaxID=364733 RepID=A0A8H7ATA4_9EURO|nr:hypothetical protein GJ744_006121 [Endocarpon pusillum]